MLTTKIKKITKILTISVYISTIKTKFMYLKTKQRIYLIAVFLTTAFFISCDVSYISDNEIDDFTWDGGVKVPLGFINYSVSEIFTDLGSEDFASDSTEEFSFSYTESFSSQNNDSFNVSIDDVTIQDELSSPITSAQLAEIGESFPYTITPQIGGVANPLIDTFGGSNQTVFDLDLSQEMTGATLNGGTMSVVLTSTSDAVTEVSLEIPSFTKKSDDSIFSETITIPANGQNSINVNLDEYNADFTNDGTGTGKTVNTVIVNLQASFTFSAGNVIEENDDISFDIALAGLSYDAIFGDFKKEAFNVSASSIDLGDFFDNFSDADVNFENIQMDITVTNDFGFPIGLDLSSIKGVGGASATSLSYDGDESLANTLIIDEVENFGDAARVTSRTLDNSNSNIAMLLEEKPTALQFNLSGSANPLSGTTANRNFYASDNSGLSAEIKISFDKISLTKEVEFDGSALEDLNSASLVAAVENRIPLGGDILLEFKNGSGQVVHTESVNAFNPADVNAQGESDGVAKNNNFSIELSSAEIESIISAETIDVKVTFVLPTGEDTVNLKGTDELSITVGLEASANISGDNN